MPTMRDTSVVLSHGLGEIVDDRPQIGAHGEPLLESLDKASPLSARVDGRVPFRGGGLEGIRLRLVALLQPLALFAEPSRRLFRQLGSLRLLQRFLDLE